MTKFLSDFLVKGVLTADNGIVMGAGKNISTTNQFYIGATNYTNSIAVGWDAGAVYLGYSMGSLPIHIGTNGTGNLVVRTSGNTIIENGNLLVGTATNSGYKVDINGEIRASLYRGANGAPLITFDAATNRVKIDGQGYGTTVGNSLIVSDYISVESRAVFNSLIRVKGSNSVVSYGISRPDAPALDAAALAGVGPRFNTLWYTGAGLSFYVSEGSDISSGAFLTEKLRLDPNGNLTVYNLAGTGTRMVTTSSTGVLGTTALPEALVINTNAEYRLITGSSTANTLNGSSNLVWYNDIGIMVLTAVASWGYGAEIDFDNRPVNGTQWGIYGGDPNNPGMVMYRYLPSGKDVSYWDIDRFNVASDVKLSFSSTTSAVGAPDVALAREAPGVIQINNGTTNAYANLKLAGITASSLAGTGERMVIANSSGVLSTQALPAAITNYVTTDTTQTISGQKTFSALTTIFDSTATATFIEGKASGVLYGGISFSLFMQFNAYPAATQGFLWKNGAGSNVMALSQTGILNLATLAGTGTRMVVADTNGNLGVQSVPTGSLQGAVDADKNTSGSLAVGTTIVKSISATTYSGVFFDYVVKNGTNVRVGSVVAITNGTSIEFYETLSNDIGTTTQLTFTVTLSSGNINLNAVAATTGWTVIVSARAI